MIGIVSAGLVIVLAAYFMVAKTWGDGPKKAKKQERAEIMRQLLALSDRETAFQRPLHLSDLGLHLRIRRCRRANPTEAGRNS